MKRGASAGRSHLDAHKGKRRQIGLRERGVNNNSRWEGREAEKKGASVVFLRETGIASYILKKSLRAKEKKRKGLGHQKEKVRETV